MGNARLDLSDRSELGGAPVDTVAFHLLYPLPGAYTVVLGDTVVVPLCLLLRVGGTVTHTVGIIS